jgi:hypothetical protein
MSDRHCLPLARPSAEEQRRNKKLFYRVIIANKKMVVIKVKV